MDMPLADFRQGGGSQAPLTMENQRVAFNICYEDGFGDELIPAAAQSTLWPTPATSPGTADPTPCTSTCNSPKPAPSNLAATWCAPPTPAQPAAIDPQGRITAQLPADTAAVLTTAVEGRSGQTPYMKLGGSWPLIGLLALTAAVLLVGRGKKAV